MIHIHLKRITKIIFLEIAKICAVEFLAQFIVHVGNKQILSRLLEGLYKYCNFTQRSCICYGYITKSVFLDICPSLNGIYEFIHHIVNVGNIHDIIRIIYSYGQIPRNIMTEGCNNAVVVGSAALSKQVWKPVHKNFCVVSSAIIKNDLFRISLACSIRIVLFSVNG